MVGFNLNQPMKYTINQFRREYPDDTACLDAILKLSYAKMPCCPQCSQKTTFKRIQGRRAYQCSDKDCQYQLYPTAGTVFEKTRTSLKDWFYIIYLMTSTRNGVSGKEIQRQLGVTYRCAWRMGHQIRKLMAMKDEILSGIVEVDETYIGGKSANMHKKKRERFNMNGKGLNSPKIGVIALLQRNGNIITQIIPQTDKSTLQGLILKHVEKGSIVNTDSHNAYKGIDGVFKHMIIDHANDEYVTDKVHHTNTVEGFFSHLKRTIKGTHIKVSKMYLQNYVNECAFKYVNRGEGQMMFFNILNRIAA